MNKHEVEILLDRYLNGKCTHQEAKLVESFFESYSKENHLQEFSEETLDQLKLKMYGRIKGRIHTLEEKTERSFFLKSKQTFVFAMLLVGVVVLAYMGYQNWGATHTKIWITKEAANGQKTTAVLSDGSSVLLNSGSRISYPETFKGSERTVTLEGEAFFNVAKNAKQPFIINSGALTTTVLGTSFNIRAYADKEIEVTVASGKVKVTETNNNHTLVLIPGQQAIYSPVNKEIRKYAVDTLQFFAWKNSTIQFDNVTLLQAANTLERWYNVQITFENPDLLNCTISGKYKNENLINILESIRFVKNINYKFGENDQIILYGKSCMT